MDKLKKRLEVLPSDDDKNLTIVLKGEDHTLGNSLRYMISLNPNVEFCGYAVPHPSEQKINLRIQTYDVPASDVFKKGLEDLMKMCDHITKTFEEAREVYTESMEDSVT